MKAKNYSVSAKNPIQKWGEEIQWKKRVKAVCKPCWEIKYCPYGPLIEEFPLKEIPDEKSCRIFGHDCPVFYVAEPLTETKELRNISRSIPRVTQFKVLKRENQICSSCSKAVKDEDVEFDHIIPWIKGGSSEEYNVKLLCRKCNRKKGKKFEEEYLIKSISEHISEPVGIKIIYLIIEFVKLSHRLFKEEGRYATVSDFCKFFGRREIRRGDEAAAEIVKDIDKFFNSKKPAEIKQKVFKALKYRWGFSDKEFHKLEEAAKIFGVRIDELLLEETSFLNRLGWQIKLTETAKKKWLGL